MGWVSIPERSVENFFFFLLLLLLLLRRGKDKGKVHPVTGHEEPEVEVELYSFFNLGARWG